MLNLSLKVVGGELEAKEIALTLPATVGRGRDVAVSLPHPLVSRQHCELLEHDGSVLVRDLDSLNGTFIGSERIEEAILSPGDLLTVGTVTFRAVYDLSPEVVVGMDSEIETMVAPLGSPNQQRRVGPEAETEEAAPVPSGGTGRQIRIDEEPHRPGLAETARPKPYPTEPV